MAPRTDWPQEITPKQIGPNFRPSAEEIAMRPRKKARTFQERSEAHLAMVRQLGCAVCETRRTIHAHHLRHGIAARERGLGLKCSDFLVVPLCWMHHEECHRVGGKFEAHWYDKFGMSAVNLAAALRANTGNLGNMMAVLAAHKRAAITTLSRRAGVNCLMAHGLTRREAEEQYDTGGRGL